MKKFARLILVAVGFGLLAPTGWGQLYVATGSNGVAGSLYTVDTTTGAQTLIAPITNASGGGGIGITGLAFSPVAVGSYAAGTLFGVTVNASSTGNNTVVRSLVTIDPNTGVATVIGSLGSTAISDISFRADGTLFGYQARGNTSMVTINLNTGAATGPSSNTSGLANTYGGGLAFSPDGTLYLSATGAALDNSPSLPGHNGTLDTLNPATGARTAGPTLTGAPFTFALNAMAFDGNGVLYAADGSGTAPSDVELVTVNLVNGAVTDLFSLPVNTDAIAFRFTPVPEPSTAAFLVLGAAGSLAMALYRRRG